VTPIVIDYIIAKAHSFNGPGASEGR